MAVAEGRGRALAAAAERARAPAAAPGNAAAAAPGISDPAAHLRPRPADAPFRCHRGVLYDLFNFLTKHVGAAAITNSFEIEGGSRTTLTVPGMKLKKKIYSSFSFFSYNFTGDPFVANYFAHNNQVAENKRQ
jgi:hypothetical protein